MNPSVHEIVYRFQLNGKKKHFEYVIPVNITQTPFEPKASGRQLPEWSKLTFQQCPNCPLNEKTVTYCPAAVAIKDIVADCNKLLSFEKVQLKVSSAGRTVTMETQIQNALSSLIGLVLANSQCPRFEFFKPMAYFHLPMATAEETMFRVFSSYLLASYFQGKVNSGVDLDPLYDIYQQLQVVNTHLAKRLQGIEGGDAAQNAVVLLHLLSCILPETLDRSLHDLRPLFKTLRLYNS